MLSSSTLEKLVEVILGDGNAFNTYRTMKQLDGLFDDAGLAIFRTDDTRFEYALRALKMCNDPTSSEFQYITREVLHRVHFFDDDPFDNVWTQSQIIDHLRPYFRKDGFDLADDATGSMYVVTSATGTPSTETLNKLSHEYVLEQIQKARTKVDSGDFDGAITNARTLVEAVQEGLILRSGNKVHQHGGDLLKLFKQTKKILSLDPSQPDLENTLLQILTGLHSIVNGVAGISNVMGDRHARKYKSSAHHAKLAVNAALTFCEFLVDSHEYQKNRRQE